ncbi:ECF transporter S component [Faecalicoccus pleomorphus]|uniref:ECF transporter S component n=1 Tax=Faecalicoccus pleomorphus TaxID=1323 RepID=UPI00242F35EC|nr:ECF transporter S component [Faecalicoccus pleomorphus]
MIKKLTIKNKSRTFTNTRILTGIAMLSAVAYVLQFIEFQLPLSPSFAKFDFSEIPAFLGGFAYGPISGITIEFIKNFLQLTSTSTGGIGELANFVIGSSLIVPASLLYQRNKTKKSAILGCLIGSILSGFVAAAMNYFVLLPLYEIFMPLDQIIAAFAQFFPFIQTKLDVVLYNALPMNILKSGLITLVTIFIYKPLSPFLKRYTSK